MAIIKKKKPAGKLVIDITGPEGNAFVLLRYAEKYAKQLGLPSSDILSDMTSGDYEHLLYVFDEYFGEYVDLAR